MLPKQTLHQRIRIWKHEFVKVVISIQDVCFCETDGCSAPLSRKRGLPLVPSTLDELRTNLSSVGASERSRGSILIRMRSSLLLFCASLAVRCASSDRVWVAHNVSHLSVVLVSGCFRPSSFIWICSAVSNIDLAL